MALAIILFATLTLVGGQSAKAGQVEVDVIADGVAVAVEAGEDAVALRAASDDLLDIFMDTQEGSDCEAFAAMAFVVVEYWARSTEAEYQDPAAYAGIVANEVLLDQWDRLARGCLEEL